MAIRNFEFKAKADDIRQQEMKLKTLNPDFIGEDHQVDTYFNVSKGRLKLREGNIENALIWYERDDIAGAKQSDVLLYKHTGSAALKQILEKLHGIKTVVDKTRKIYFIKNVKFHFDKVKGAGEFIEVEAIDSNDEITIDELRKQCLYYADLFGIQQDDYISNSYSDMIQNHPA